MTTSSEHPLFDQYPLSGEVELTTGTVPTPYHIYDGHATFIGGTAELAGVSELLDGERVTPVETTDGHALMGVWVIDATDASLGPHQELQVSFFVSRQPIPPLEPHPFAILSLLLSDHEVKMMAHGLWNDSRMSVAYNREVLGLDPHLMRSEIHREPERKRFAFDDAETDTLLLKGHVHEANRPPMDVIMPAIRAFGLRNFLRNLSLPTLSVGVVNPITEVLPDNHVAQTYSKSEAMLLQFFDPATDTLALDAGPYADLDFRPAFVEHMAGFKFVYLNPQPWV